MTKIIIILVLFFTLPYLVYSQMVNIEKKRIGSKGSGLQGSVDLSLTIKEYNDEIIQGKTNIRLQYHKKRSTFLIFNEISLIQINDVRYLNEGFEHFRYNYDFPNDWLVGEFFLQHQYNAPKKIDNRVLVGIGPRFKIIDRDSLGLFFGPLSVYEYEQLMEGLGETNRLRLSSYISFRYIFSKLLSFNNITYYQPDYGNLNDYKIATENNLFFNIGKGFSFKVSFKLTYDSDPPEGVTDLFYSLENGLKYSF